MAEAELGGRDRARRATPANGVAIGVHRSVGQEDPIAQSAGGVHHGGD